MMQQLPKILSSMSVVCVFFYANNFAMTFLIPMRVCLTNWIYMKLSNPYIFPVSHTSHFPFNTTNILAENFYVFSSTCDVRKKSVKSHLFTFIKYMEIIQSGFVWFCLMVMNYSLNHYELPGL